MFYAPSRLGYSSFGAMVFGAGLPKAGAWKLLVSRVVEHTALFAIACLRFLIDECISLKVCKRIVFLCDPGPHFRAWAFLGSVLRLCEDKKISAEVHYGCEHHTKTVVDGLFGRVQYWKRCASSEKMLSDLSDIVDALNERGSRDSILDPERPPFQAYEYMPGPKKDVPAWRLQPFCSPLGVSLAYSWSFVINDVRRATPSSSLRGRFPNNSCLTGINATCWIANKVKSPFSTQFNPIITDVPVEVMAEGATEEPKILNFNTREKDGWRLTYRGCEPEKEPHDKVSLRMRKKYEKLGLYAAGMGVPSRHVGADRRHATAVHKRQQAREREQRRARGLQQLIADDRAAASGAAAAPALVDAEA